MKRVLTILSILLIFSMCMVSVLSFDSGAVRATGDDPGQSGDVPPSVAEEENFDDGIEEIVWSYDEAVEVTYHVTSQ